MQSLSDSTLAAFMKTDLSKEFDNAVGKSNNASLARTKKQKSTKRKNETESSKYLNNSFVLSSKDSSANKENELPSSLELDTILESPKNRIDIKNSEKNVSKKCLRDRPNLPKCSNKRMNINGKVLAGNKLIKKKNSSCAISRVGMIEETNLLVNPSEQIPVSKNNENQENSVNNSPITSGLPSTENNSLGLLSLKSHQTTTNSSIEISSRICTQDRCKLASWGLPLTILRKYESRGVTSMFPWQVECLSNPELLENNRNLVYSAPTSAGKTLVAEILVIKAVIERRKKVIFILPFVSVVREKMYYFQDLLSDSGLRVEGFMGGCAPAGGFAATDVAIATIEKANSLLNQLMEEGNLVTLGAVVIDELHLLGDPHRGYLLELLLTKLKYMRIREELVNVQLIGMSATLPNLGILAKWLDAELYKTDFRPIPLDELCKIGDTIYDNKMNNVRELRRIPELKADSDNILQLCIETITDGHSVLIFCPTKNWCEKLALQVALTFGKLGRENTRIGRILRGQLSMEAIVEILEQLKRSPAGLDDVLKSTVSFGAAFHHAGLTMDERDVIEGGFRSGAIRVLTATSTLSSGVNLPARRVIIRSLMFHGKPLDTLTYRQMIGRAGRMGKDTAGESILVCKSNETRAATCLLSSNLPPIESCLEGSEPLVRALLEAVASEVAYTASDIELYTRCTLVSHTSEDLIDESTRMAIKFLLDNELFMLQTTKNGDERWVATQLGKACLAASIPPTDGLFLFEELEKARRCFVLDTELHVIYLVTPLNSSSQIGQIDWFVFLDIWKSITESERRVGQLVGVDENFIISGVRGNARNGKILDIHKRFYTALALHELVREVPLQEVCRKYGCCRGVVQSLQQSAATFAGMVTQFCKKLGWNCMELLIGQFQARLQFGVCRELLDLLRLPLLNGLRARSLYNEGITCVAELAIANELDVERALHKALPFESGKEQNGEHVYDAAKRKKMRCVFVTGRDGLTPQDAARILVKEARTLVQNELGVDAVQWKQREQSTRISDESGSLGKISDPSVQENSTSINPSIIGNSDETIEGHSGRKSELNVEDFRGDKESSAKGPNELEIIEIDAEIRKLVPETTELNETRSSDNRIECNSSIVFSEHSFEFTSPGNTVSQKAIIIGSKRCEEIYSQGTSDSTRNGNAIDPKEDVTGSKVRDKIYKDGDFSTTGNAIDRKVATIGSKTREKICNEDIFEFTSTGNAIDRKILNIGSKTCEKICNHNISERTGNGNSSDPNENAIGSTTLEEMCKEASFDFANTGNAISANNVTIGSKTCNEIFKEGSFDFACTGNEINPKKVTIGSKTRNEIFQEGSFDFACNGNAINPKEAVGSKIGNEIFNEGSFDFASTGNIISPKEVTIGSKTCNEIFKEVSFDFACTGNVVDPKEIGSKNRKEICAGGTCDFTKTGSKSGTKSSSGCRTKDVTIASKTREEMFKDIFEFTGNGALSCTGGSINEREKLIRPNSKSLTKDPDSRSPSLFGDSLNLDTQECNLLEQNVIDSLNISSFGDTNVSGFVESRKNTPENRISDSTRSNRRSSSQRRFSLINTSSRRSPRISGLKNRSKSLAWEDDSWNNTNGVIETVNMLNTATNSRIIDTNKNCDSETPVESKVSQKNVKQSHVLNYDDRLTPKKRIMNTNENRDSETTAESKVSEKIVKQSNVLHYDDRLTPKKRIKNTNKNRNSETLAKPRIPEEIVKQPRMLNYDDRLTPKKRAKESKKIAQKRKLSESSIERSPIANLLNNPATRKISDSDDIVISSQSISTLSNVTKNRTRLKLESLKKSRTQHAQSTNKTNTGVNELEDNNRSDDLLCDNCSIESVVSNSDEENPVKRANDLTRIKSIRSVENASTLRKKLIGSGRSRIDETKSKKSQTACPQEIEVINVATNRTKFNQFRRDFTEQKDIALALACETFHQGTISIGTKIIGITGIDGRKRTKKIENCIYDNKKICGIAISWDGNVVHYISFDNTNESKVPVKERLDFLTDILNSGDLTVRCFSFKETYKILYNCCGIASSCNFLDPKTADWLLDPDHSERSFNALIAEHFTEAQFLLQRTGPHLGCAGPGLNVKSAISSEIRATTEAALTWHLTNILMTKLEGRSAMLLETFRDIEMGTLSLLARMELTGLGVNLKSLQELSEVIQQEMSQLENRAYTLAGKKFNFSSSKSVAQVLGFYKGKKVSTNKAALEHCENPISRLVVSWRKLSATQIKVVFPLLSLAECNSRIHGNCVTNTVTGRVSMYEPNLQNVPRDFNSQDDSFVISVRMAFVPVHGNVILSADYCQLELRILAHFSKEPNLCRILRKKGDVFKNIAARWYNVAEEKIDDGMRQRTKQLCYGMIYGMGVKTLAETLSVNEIEAKEFLETFIGAYPGIRRWLSHVIEKARNDGYVTTLMQRRRFLPALNSEIPGERSQAERQAVNTKVQGSAADIAKTAMVRIDERMRREFPDTPLVLTDVPIKRKLRSCSREELPRGGYLILQIHDELLYEVNARDLEKVGKIIKESMEKSCELRVPLPVKLKIGPTWGDLTEHEF